jgi:hypothetical protein
MVIFRRFRGTVCLPWYLLGLSVAVTVKLSVFLGVGYGYLLLILLSYMFTLVSAVAIFSCLCGAVCSPWCLPWFSQNGTVELSVFLSVSMILLKWYCGAVRFP